MTPMIRAATTGAGPLFLAIALIAGALAGVARADSAPDRRNPRIMDITDFGAKGDGIADDSGAVRAALAAARQLDFDYVMVYAPPGCYRLASPVSAPLLTGSSHICFSGVSPAATVFRIDNPEGGFHFTFEGGGRKDRMDFVNFAMEVTNQNTGYFLRIVGPPGGGVTDKYDARLENLVFGSEDGNAKSRYGVSGAAGNCVYLYALKRAIINRCTVWNTPSAVSDNAALPRSILALENCYKPYIQNSYFNGAARVGLLFENRTPEGEIERTEGTYIQNCTINGPLTSCLVRNSGPEFWFMNNHCNFRLHGLSIADGRKYIYLQNNLMYIPGNDDVKALPRGDVPWHAPQGVTDFHLHKVANAVIGGNIFRTVVRAAEAHPSSLVRTHYHLAGCRYVSIRDDKYAARSTRQPIYADATSGLFIILHEQGWQMDFSDYRCRLPGDQVEYTSSVTGKLRFDGLSETTEIFFNRP